MYGRMTERALAKLPDRDVATKAGPYEDSIHLAAPTDGDSTMAKHGVHCDRDVAERTIVAGDLDVVQCLMEEEMLPTDVRGGSVTAAENDGNGVGSVVAMVGEVDADVENDKVERPVDAAAFGKDKNYKDPSRLLMRRSQPMLSMKQDVSFLRGQLAVSCERCSINDAVALPALAYVVAAVVAGV